MKSKKYPISMSEKPSYYDGMKLTIIEDNSFAKLLYEKPVPRRGDSKIKKIGTRFKERKYWRNNVKPVIDNLRNNAPTFFTMCEFADFIKIIEKVFFYYNDIKRANTVDMPLKTRILADQKMEQHDKKIIIIDMQKEMITIKLEMTRKYNEDDEKYDDIISGTLQYQFGKDLFLKFVIVNSKIDFNSVHDFNLMYNINLILQDSMADLFEEYYHKVTE